MTACRKPDAGRNPSNIARPPYAPWQRLYLRPLPHGHFSLRPIFPRSSRIVRRSAHRAQVQAGGCSLCQLVRVVISIPPQPEFAP